MMTAPGGRYALASDSFNNECIIFQVKSETHGIGLQCIRNDFSYSCKKQCEFKDDFVLGHEVSAF